MCEGIIYKATNLINQKVYIGKSIYSLEERRKRHEDNSLKDKPKIYFHKAIKKYGIENFNWKIIDSVDNEEELNLLEQLYIADYREKGKVYNLTDGGDGMSGFNHSEATKKKMSESKMGLKRKPFTKATIKKMSESQRNSPNCLGYKHTEETKKKISEAHKGHKRNLGSKRSDETRLKMSESSKGEKHPMYGKHHTEESKRKMSESQKGHKNNLGHKHTNEAKKRMSESHKGRKHTEETIRKLREAQRIRREREACCV